MKNLTLCLVCFLISMGTTIAQNKSVSDLVVDFESDPPGKVYPCIAWYASNINAVVKKNPSGTGQSLHILSSSWQVCPKFTITLPEGKTLANVKKISFDIYFGTGGASDQNDRKNFYCMFGEKGSAALEPDNLRNENTTRQLISGADQNPLQTWLSKEFNPIIPESSASLNQFDWAFGLEAAPGDYYLDNITFTFREEGAMKITNIFFSPAYKDYYYEESNLQYNKTPYYEGTQLKDPVTIEIANSVSAPVNVKYSLYTIKREALHSVWADMLYELTSCNYGLFLLKDKIETQADIDKYLNKFYEFPVVNETKSGKRTLYWNGKTDPAVTKQKEAMPVRACVYLAAHNADTGEPIAVDMSFRGVEFYKTMASPIMTFTKNTDAQGKETLSGKIILAYDKPVKLTAILTTADGGCRRESMSYDILNKGTDVIIAALNAGLTDEYAALAYVTLPEVDPKTGKEKVTVDPEDSNIRTFEWNDIKKINWNDPKWKEAMKDAKWSTDNPLTWGPISMLDGDYFFPYPEDERYGYMMLLIVEALDDNGNPVVKTFSGLNDGYLGYGGIGEIPEITNPKSITGIKEVKAEKITLVPDGGNFKIVGTNGVVSGKSYKVFDLLGREIVSGSGQTIITADLPNGTYIIYVNTEQGVVTQKIVKRDGSAGQSVAYCHCMKNM